MLWGSGSCFNRGRAYQFGNPKNRDSRRVDAVANNTAETTITVKTSTLHQNCDSTGDAAVAKKAMEATSMAKTPVIKVVKPLNKEVSNEKTSIDDMKKNSNNHLTSKKNAR